MSIYLDHAAGTPMLPESAAVLANLLSMVGNASSVHTSGQQARRLVEESREQVAAALGASPSEVVFTSGGTEANNHAAKGLYWQRNQGETRPVIMASAIEHPAMVEPIEWLVKQPTTPARGVWLGVDQHGVVDLDAARAAMSGHAQDVAFIAVMAVNSEVGSVQPVAEIAHLAATDGIPVHCDAVQAVGHQDLNFGTSALSTMTVTGHKVGGPVGVGALLIRRGTTITPLLHGGQHERGMRSGTVNVPGIVAFATAIDLAVSRRIETDARLESLRESLIAGIKTLVPDAQFQGPTNPDQRVPGIVHVIFPGCEGDSLLYLLDAQGIECSTGTACHAGVPQPSRVLQAMGIDQHTARGALRLSLGHNSTQHDVDGFLAVLPAVIDRARNAGLASLAAVNGAS